MTAKRRFGDRRDGRWVRDGPGLQTIMGHMMVNRTDAEVYINERIDCTEVLQYIARKNAEHPEYKTTLFHCLVLAVARMVRERPKMNRFVAGRRTYQRDEITLSFVVKRRFADNGEEALMVYKAKDEDTIDTLSRKIVGDVKETRKSETASGGIDATVEAFAKIPRLLLMFVIRVIRWLDFWGLVPKALTEGDTNFTSVLLTNLGSIQCDAIYHHLNNYGTNSIVVSVGTIHKEEIVMPDGHKEIRDVVNIGATVDERIGDGFYFARSLKLVKHIFANPELLDRPLGEISGYDYK